MKKYYQEHADVIRDRAVKWSKDNNYSYERTPDRIVKQRIRTATRNLYKKGILLKLFCVDCGVKKNLHFHHNSYNPMDVIVLCNICHKERHLKLNLLSMKKEVRCS